jgi:KaiC/GvpD/RAD55 family RecA-like ATPase
MLFIEDNNAPDFWSRDHYADDPNHPLYNFQLEGEQAPTPSEQRQTTNEKRTKYSSFHQVKAPRHNLTKPEEDIFPKNSLIVLAGQPKIGKTTIAIALAKAIATGKPFAGQKTKKQPVGYISFDDSPREISEAFAKHKDITDKTPIFLTSELEPINTRSAHIEIEDFLIQHRGDATVIIDSFHAALLDARTNDARAMRKLLNPLKQISERAGRIILIHHTNAYGTRIADHTQLQAAVSQTILMTYEQRAKCRIIKWQSQGRGAGATRTSYIASPDETTFHSHSFDPRQGLDRRDKSTRPLLRALTSAPKTVAQLVIETRLTPTRVHKRLRKLIELGHVSKRHGTYELIKSNKR